MSQVDDLCTLPDLSDTTILSCLEKRYQRGLVYVSWPNDTRGHSAMHSGVVEHDTTYVGHCITVEHHCLYTYTFWNSRVVCLIWHVW